MPGFKQTSFGEAGTSDWRNFLIETGKMKHAAHYP